MKIYRDVASLTRLALTTSGSILATGIYRPMIYTASYVMFLMRANPLQGSLEGLGRESRDFFGPCNSWSEARAVSAQQSRKIGIAWCKMAKNKNGSSGPLIVPEGVV